MKSDQHRTFHVFLASSFAEFTDLRAQLRERINRCAVPSLRAIDLDDGTARGRAPLRTSRESVVRSDVVVLLLGREYGGCPAEETRSYAHLEYEAAREAGDDLVILPYFCGYETHEEVNDLEDLRLRAWCQELNIELTPACFPQRLDNSEVAESILVHIQKAIFDLLTESQRQALDAMDAFDGAVDSGPSKDELDRLAAFLGDEEPSVSSSAARISDEDARRSPALVASLEQRREAFRALEMGERSIAVRHLRRGLDQTPLDADACYWLARLLVMTGRRDACQEAETLSLRSAKVAGTESRGLHVAASLIIASRAAALLEARDRAIDHAAAAVETANLYAAAHAELATRLAESGDRSSSFDSISDAFFRHPPTALKALRREAIFRLHTHEVRDYLDRLQSRVGDAVRAVLAAEEALTNEEGGDPPDSGRLQDTSTPSSHQILRLLDASRKSTSRQVDLLRDIVARTQGDLQEMSRSIQQLRSRQAEKEQSREREITDLQATDVAPPAAVVVGSLLLALVVASMQKSVVLLVALPVVVLVLILGVSLYRRDSLGKKVRELRRRQEQEREAEAAEVARIEETMLAYRRRAWEKLADSVEALESSALRWSILSPTRGLSRVKTGDLLRLHPVRTRDEFQLELDTRLFPPGIGEDIPVSETSRHQLFRVQQRSGNRIQAARWACYF